MFRRCVLLSVGKITTESAPNVFTLDEAISKMLSMIRSERLLQKEKCSEDVLHDKKCRGFVFVLFVCFFACG